MQDLGAYESMWEADRLARLGISAVPLPFGSKIPVRGFQLKPLLDAGCPRSPAEVRRRFLAATEVTPDIVRPCNLGILLGPPSGGLGVLDFDSLADAERFEAAFPEFAGAAPSTKTPRGGRHWFFRNGRFPHSSHARWGDLKVTGYVVAPPSVAAR
jgi:hypothetical protein